MTAAVSVVTFQSTLPVRGGTRWGRYDRFLYKHFNPPSPCGEGRQSGHTYRYEQISSPPCGGGTRFTGQAFPATAISIHPPVRGGTCRFYL